MRHSETDRQTDRDTDRQTETHTDSRGRYGESLQVTPYDPYLSASEVVFHKRGAISSVLPFFTFTQTETQTD